MARGKILGRVQDTGVEQFEYIPETFIPFLKELITARNLSLRQVSLGAGLDHGAVRRYVNGGTKPSRDACISLAHYFDIHPNVMLEKAGYPSLAYFDLSLADPEEFSPEVKEVAAELMKIEDITARRRVCSAFLQLMRELLATAGPAGTDCLV